MHRISLFRIICAQQITSYFWTHNVKNLMSIAIRKVSCIFGKRYLGLSNTEKGGFWELGAGGKHQFGLWHLLSCGNKYTHTKCTKCILSLDFAFPQVAQFRFLEFMLGSGIGTCVAHIKVINLLVASAFLWKYKYFNSEQARDHSKIIQPNENFHQTLLLQNHNSDI